MWIDKLNPLEVRRAVVEGGWNRYYCMDEAKAHQIEQWLLENNMHHTALTAIDGGLFFFILGTKDQLWFELRWL